MSELYLPPEIQRVILEHAFDQLGFEACARLRSVNHLFDSELMKVFTRKEALRQWLSILGSKENESKRLFIVRYLTAQRWPSSDRKDGEFASLLHYALDEIERLERPDAPVKSRYLLTYDLCRHLSLWRILLRIHAPTTKALFSADHLPYHVLAAAICLEKHTIVSSLRLDPHIASHGHIRYAFVGSPLTASIRTRQLNIAKSLLDQGADVNEHDHAEGYILARAVKAKCIDTLQLVLEPEYGCVINDCVYEHAIIDAIRTFPPGALILLQRCAVNFTLRRWVLRSGLCYACRLGLLDIVHVLAEHVSLQMLREFIAESWGPLEDAAAQGNTDVVRYLISKDHHLVYPQDEDNAFSDCAVLAATYEGQTSTALVLLEAGVEIHDLGRNLFEAAASRPQSVDLIRTLIERGDIDPAPSGNALNSDYRQVPWVLLACRYGNTDFLKLLAQHDVDVAKPDQRELRPTHSPMNIAKVFEQDEVVQCLLAIGAEDEDLPEDFSKYTILGDHHAEPWLSQQDLRYVDPSFKERGPAM